MASAQSLNARKKAAMVLVSLGPELSSRVLRLFKQSDVEDLVLEVLTLGSVGPDASNQVVDEFYHRAVNFSQRPAGGMPYAKDLLAKTLGDERAREILTRLTEQGRPRPFGFLRQTNPGQVASMLEEEHPQTIALVLSHLPHSVAAGVLQSLPMDVSAEVAMRIAVMDRTSPEVVDAVESTLQQRMSGVTITDFARVGGPEFIAKVLGQTDRNTERSIIGVMDERNTELAAQVRGLLFTFDQLTLLDDRSLQRILREVDQKDLATALKGASSELVERILNNLSSRTAEVLREEMSLAGNIRPRQVVEAQQRVVAIVRRLEDSEEITIERRGGHGDL
jgi:flagellar motor switch protein FliG